MPAGSSVEGWDRRSLGFGLAGSVMMGRTVEPAAASASPLTKARPICLISDWSAAETASPGLTQAVWTRFSEILKQEPYGFHVVTPFYEAPVLRLTSPEIKSWLLLVAVHPNLPNVADELRLTTVAAEFPSPTAYSPARALTTNELSRYYLKHIELAAAQTQTALSPEAPYTRRAG